ncbi:MAG TPA: phosphatase PAP2 family protein [Kofleriaceae bacterium]|jgi:membrane-associated phospholipid phosphatase
MGRITAVAVALVSLATPAFADGPPAAERPADATVDGAIIAAAVAASLAPMALRLRGHGLWDTQLLGPVDRVAIGQLSGQAAQLSDLMLAVSIAAPAAYLTGTTIEDSDGDRLAIYGETLAVDLALVQVAKYLVQRPRPYLYNGSTDALQLAAAAGDDGWTSFYSSHAAMSFGAAVAGAYLLSTTNAHPIARAVAWGTGLAAAAATSNLRVRAGRHFYSDILLGALIGTGVGYAVPALHARGKPYSPSSNDIAAAGVGLFGGLVASQLIPMRGGGPADHPRALMVDQLHVAPLALADGAGLAVSGRVRSRSWGRVPLSRAREATTTMTGR